MTTVRVDAAGDTQFSRLNPQGVFPVGSSVLLAPQMARSVRLQVG